MVKWNLYHYGKAKHNILNLPDGTCVRIVKSSKQNYKYYFLPAGKTSLLDAECVHGGFASLASAKRFAEDKHLS